MCDNAAVQWSEFEAEKSRIESNLRNQIAEKLFQHIGISVKSGYPETYIQGMERAREIVLMTRIDDTLSDTGYVQENLFD